MAFATAEQLRIRLGLAELTTDQSARADSLLVAATAAIADAVDENDEWSDDLDPIPDALEALCLDVAARAFNAPAGIRSEQTTLGSYSHNVSYPDAAAMGVALTDAETLRVRRIVHGSNAAGATAETAADDLSAYYPESWPT